MNGIIGQEAARSSLEKALQSGRMHHAWIFHGPFGTGKATLARGLARSLLSGSRELLDGRGWDHPDLHWISKELASESAFSHLRQRKQMSIPVDLLRERMIGGWIGGGDGRHYVEPVIARSAVGKHGKVFVVDEAERLAREGQNALLKTLEEPPPGTTIFLITSHEQRLLPTIRSRCQRVGFAALSDEQVRRWLEDRLAALQRESLEKAEKESAPSGKSRRKKSADTPAPPPELSDEQKTRIVRFADGSAGRAELALHFRLDEWVETLTPMVRQIRSGFFPPDFGHRLNENIQAMAEACVADNPSASKDAANKQAAQLMLSILHQFCRAAIQAELKKHPAGDRDTLGPVTACWLGGIDLIHAAQTEMDGNVPLPLLLDNLALQWSRQVPMA